jgi:hypothetical protein
MNIETLLQDYQLYTAGAVLVIIIGCIKSEEFRNWLIRLTIFALIITLCYFGFQKIKYHFRSGQEVNPFNEEMPAEENAGMKYYRDPDKEIQKQTGE